ncbi:MAG: phage capsid protein [Pseudomonadota bacterium]
MSINIPTFYAQQFSTNVALKLQQMGSKLRMAVTEGSYVGSQASPVDQIAAVEAQPVTQRFGPMGRVDAALDRRWVFPLDFDLPQLIDKFDKLRLLTDPESQYVINAVYGLGRKIDTVILAAMFGTAKTGVNGATSTILPTSTSTNVVSLNVGGTNSNLNVAKLRAAKKFLMAGEVDIDVDPIFCAVDSVNHDALLNEIQIISSDFNGADRPVLADGKVTRFLGINFIHTERVAAAGNLATDDQTTSTTSKQVPIWAKSGMHLGIWNDITGSISVRNDLQGEPFQAYNYMTIGATRIEEPKTVKVWCAA